MRRALRDWRTPALLFLVCLIPFAGTADRLAWFARGADFSGEDAHLVGFATIPAPILLHIVPGSVFCLLAIFQFWTAFRARHPKLHKAMGRLAVAMGLVSALSAVVMPFVYPWSPLVNTASGVLRFVAAIGMLAAIVLSVAAIRHGRIAAHRLWMARAFALAVGGATTGVMMIGWTLAMGEIWPPALTVALALGWAINLGYVERKLNRRQAPVAAA